MLSKFLDRPVLASRPEAMNIVDKDRLAETFQQKLPASHCLYLMFDR